MEAHSGDSLMSIVKGEGYLEVIEESTGSVNAIISDDKVLEEDKLRKRLKFFFMNPLEKWRNKQRIPYKFAVQIIKILVVTIQAGVFAHYRNFHVDFVWSNRIAFSHLFLEGWDSSREVIAYPPAAGDLAIYKKSEFFSAIDFAVVNYANLDAALGLYAHPTQSNSTGLIQFCYDHYKACDVFGSNGSYIFKKDVVRTCVHINVTKADAGNFSSEVYFLRNNVNLQFSSLIQGYLSFVIKTVNFKTLGPTAPPNCYKFNLTVVFDNEPHNGQVKISLKVVTFRLICHGSIENADGDRTLSLEHSILDSVAIVFCFLSLGLCSRSMYRAQVLRRRTVAFFKKFYYRDVSLKGQLEFLDGWYLTTIVSDVIVITGSCLKKEIEKNEFFGDQWNVCGLLLGVGTLLIWFCVLRYFCFFKTYNIVILTLKVAAPLIFRFLICTLIIYAGFLFCGWLVLGPYHLKFRTISIASETLFSLINGDDMFATFSTLLPTQSLLIRWFCQVYLYVFVSLFIYVILSLFVSVILDSYETIKSYSTHGFPKNDIQTFIDGVSESPLTELFSDSSSSLEGDLPCGNFNLKNFARWICCCAKPLRSKYYSTTAS